MIRHAGFSPGGSPPGRIGTEWQNFFNNFLEGSTMKIFIGFIGGLVVAVVGGFLIWLYACQIEETFRAVATALKVERRECAEKADLSVIQAEMDRLVREAELAGVAIALIQERWAMTKDGAKYAPQNLDEVVAEAVRKMPAPVVAGEGKVVERQIVEKTVERLPGDLRRRLERLEERSPAETLVMTPPEAVDMSAFVTKSELVDLIRPLVKAGVEAGIKEMPPTTVNLHFKKGRFKAKTEVRAAEEDAR